MRRRVVFPFALLVLVAAAVRADETAPKLTVQSAKGLDHEFRIGVPEGWRFQTTQNPKSGELGMHLVPPQVGATASAALSIFIVPCPAPWPEYYGSPSSDVRKILSTYAKTCGLAPVLDASKDVAYDYYDYVVGTYGRLSITAFSKDAQGKPHQKAVLTAVSVPKLAHARIVIRQWGLASSFAGYDTWCRFALQTFEVVGAKGAATRIAPFVLGPPPAAPETPLDGIFFDEQRSWRWDDDRHGDVLEKKLTVYRFAPSGWVQRTAAFPTAGEAFDPVRASACLPRTVGIYETRGNQIVLRFPEEKPLAMGFEATPELLTLGTKVYERVDRDLSSQVIVGTFSYLTADFSGGISSRSTHLFTFDKTGRFEESFFFTMNGTVFHGNPADPSAPKTVVGSNDRDVQRGAYRLGRGTITFRYDNGAERTAWVHLGPKSVTIGGVDYTK